MTFLKQLSISILIFILLIVGYPLSKSIFFFIEGHYIGSGPKFAGRIAKLITVKKLPIGECKKMEMNPFEIIQYPVIEDLRDQCIAAVADNRKNPAECEPLLPGSYGLQCIADTLGSRQCYFMSNKTFSWRDEEVQKESVDGCEAKNLSEKGKDCCLIAKLHFLEDHNDCSALKDKQDMFNLCEYELAVKKKNISVCDQISTENEKVACQLEVKYAE